MIVVQKYGGTSVGDFKNPTDITNLNKIADNVISYQKKGKKVVVVLSAMSKMTNHLFNIAQVASKKKVDKRELDALVTIGEQMSVALLAMILKDRGKKAISLNAFQAGINTSTTAGNARIESIDKKKIKKLLDEKNIIIITGFQGIDKNRNITTLGRGGSDTSAVAIAAALKADICEIYTDVDGIYTADPNICKVAKKLDVISYDEMLEMASLGAKVLQIRSVEFAKKYGVRLKVLSSFSNKRSGTMLISEDENMEKLLVSGVVCDRDQARITFKKVPDTPGIASKIFVPISKEKIQVDMIIQNTRADGKTDLSFTILKKDFQDALKISKKIEKKINAEGLVTTSSGIAKISVVGIGMKTHSGVAAKMFKTLSDNNINIRLITTSEIRISCMIDEEYAELATRKLHTAFGLDKKK